MNIAADILNFPSMLSVQEFIQVINLRLECGGDGVPLGSFSDDCGPVSRGLDFPSSLRTAEGTTKPPADAVPDAQQVSCGLMRATR